MNNIESMKLTADLVRELLDYDPTTGIFVWKKRDRKHFKTAAEWTGWNKRQTGKQAGSLKGRGYIEVRIFGTLYGGHRLAWLIQTGSWPDNHLDHINQCRNDNRFENLRAVTVSENGQNRRRALNNTSGTTGVSFDKLKGCWKASITLAGDKQHLGWFETKAEAVECREIAQLAYGFHPNHGIDINNGDTAPVSFAIEIDYP